MVRSKKTTTSNESNKYKQLRRDALAYCIKTNGIYNVFPWGNNLVKSVSGVLDIIYPENVYILKKSNQLTISKDMYNSTSWITFDIPSGGTYNNINWDNPGLCSIHAYYLNSKYYVVLTYGCGSTGTLIKTAVINEPSTNTTITPSWKTASIDNGIGYLKGLNVVEDVHNLSDSTSTALVFYQIRYTYPPNYFDFYNLDFNIYSCDSGASWETLGIHYTTSGVSVGNSLCTVYMFDYYSELLSLDDGTQPCIHDGQNATQHRPKGYCGSDRISDKFQFPFNYSKSYANFHWILYNDYYIKCISKTIRSDYFYRNNKYQKQTILYYEGLPSHELWLPRALEAVISSKESISFSNMKLHLFDNKSAVEPLSCVTTYENIQNNTCMIQISNLKNTDTGSPTLSSISSSHTYSSEYDLEGTHIESIYQDGNLLKVISIDNTDPSIKYLNIMPLTPILCKDNIKQIFI